MWLNDLLEEMQGISPDNFVEPEDEVDLECEEVVGGMSDDLKRFYTFLHRVGREQKMSCHIFHSRQSASGEEIQAHRREHTRYKAFRNLFWESVYKEFPKAEKLSDRGIGVRKDFLVVRILQRSSINVEVALACETHSEKN